MTPSMTTTPHYAFQAGLPPFFSTYFPSNASETKRMLSLICSWEERRNSPCGLMIRHFPPEEKIAGSSPASDCFFLFCYSPFRFLFAAYCFLCKDEERKERAESHGRQPNTRENCPFDGPQHDFAGESTLRFPHLGDDSPVLLPRERDYHPLRVAKLYRNRQCTVGCVAMRMNSKPDASFHIHFIPFTRAYA